MLTRIYMNSETLTTFTTTLLMLFYKYLFGKIFVSLHQATGSPNASKQYCKEELKKIYLSILVRSLEKIKNYKNTSLIHYHFKYLKILNSTRKLDDLQTIFLSLALLFLSRVAFLKRRRFTAFLDFQWDRVTVYYYNIV